MNCPRCAVSVPPESRFCLECGAYLASLGEARCPTPDAGKGVDQPELEGSSPAPFPTGDWRPASDDCLVQANLLRMRGRWEEAARQCAEALQRQPTNASAHSLLGDIYENRGRLEDAIHWYQLALELNPASVADQAKLARARELVEARRKAVRSAGCGVRGGTEAAASHRAESHEPALTPHSALRTPHGSEATISWLRVATVTGIAFCCTILALAIVFSASERREWLLERGSPAARRSPITDRRGHGLTVWPDGRSPLSRRTARSEVGRPTGFAGGAAPGQAEERGEFGNTPRELQLLAGLRGVPPPLGADTQPSLRPNDVWLDPRTAAATVRASLDTLDGRELSGIGGRSAASPDAASGLGLHPPPAILLEREVYRLALRLTQLDRRIALVHVHVLVPLADPNDRRAPELAFIATLESAALTADPNRLTDADLQNLFRDAWWVPPVR